MKVISVWQPWAQLLVEGKKHDETRSWATKYRGPILIHASKNLNKGMFKFYLPSELKHFEDAGILDRFDSLQRGAIIGIANLVDCKLIDNSYHEFTKNLCPAEFVFGDFTVGRYAWVMQDPVLFKEPIPCRGYQGLWNYNDEIKEVQECLKR